MRSAWGESCSAEDFKTTEINCVEQKFNCN
jgi:hypothetical protein